MNDPKSGVPTARVKVEQIKVKENSTVMLDASNSTDPDNDQLTFKWKRLLGDSKGTLTNENNKMATFNAPSVNKDQLLLFVVEVSDKSHTSKAYLTVTIEDDGSADNPPNAVVDSPTIPVHVNGSNVSMKVELDASKSNDPDGGKLTFKWSELSNHGISIANADSKLASFQTPKGLTKDTVYKFEVEVMDEQKNTDTTQVTVNVKVKSTVFTPVAQVASKHITVYEGKNVELDASSSTDPNGDVLKFLWTQSGANTITLTDSKTSKAKFKAPSVNSDTDFMFKVEVEDPSGNKDSEEVKVTVKDGAPATNSAPKIVLQDSVITRYVGNGGSALIALDASKSTDADNDALTYLWKQESGDSVSLSGAQGPVAYFVSPAISKDTTLVFEVAVSDAVNVSKEKVTVHLKVGSEQGKPIVKLKNDYIYQNSGTKVELDASGSTDYAGSRNNLKFKWSQVYPSTPQLKFADDSKIKT